MTVLALKAFSSAVMAGRVGLRRSMLDALKNFLNEFSEGTKEAHRFEENDYRLAAAALLVHTMWVDGRADESERTKLREILQQHFSLDDAATDELIEAATAADREAVDLYHFTRLLNRSLDEKGRIRMIEMMWQIVYADGHLSEFENNIVWRAADLLGVSGQERVALRRRIASASIQPGRPSSD